MKMSREVREFEPPLERSCGDNTGAALLAALGLLFIFVTVGFLFYESMKVESQWNDMDIARVRAYYCAVGGIEAALEGLRNDPEALVNSSSPILQHTFEDEAGSYTLKVEKKQLSDRSFGYLVTSTGKSNVSGMLGRQQIRIIVEIQPDVARGLRIISWQEGNP